MSQLIATKRVDLLAPYLALDQGSRVQAECECLFNFFFFHNHSSVSSEGSVEGCVGDGFFTKNGADNIYALEYFLLLSVIRDMFGKSARRSTNRHLG